MLVFRREIEIESSFGVAALAQVVFHFFLMQFVAGKTAFFRQELLIFVLHGLTRSHDSPHGGSSMPTFQPQNQEKCRFSARSLIS